MKNSSSNRIYSGRSTQTLRLFGWWIVIVGSEASRMSTACHVHRSVAGVLVTRNIAVTEAGRVYVWGNTSFSGANDAHLANVPLRVLNLPRAIMVASGTKFSAVVGRNGSLWTWGVEFGTGHTALQRNPTQIPRQTFSSDVAMISCGRVHSVALTANGQVWTCGYGTDGALGHGDRQ